MLVKLTSKNQLALPKVVIEQVPQAQYFDVRIEGGQIVLTPVPIANTGNDEYALKPIWQKLEKLGITENDIDNAVKPHAESTAHVQLARWLRRISIPDSAKAKLGFGYEYWNLDPAQYEGWEQLRERLNSHDRSAAKRAVAYELSSHLLEDVVVAAGGVETSIATLRRAIADLQIYIQINNIRPKNDSYFLSRDAATTAWYAFADLLAWARGIVERIDRLPADRKKFPRQGLLPAIKPKRLKRKIEQLLIELQNGPVGQARLLANFMLHSALVQHPHSGVRVSESGSIILPIPNSPSSSVAHWYLLNWDAGRDGITLAEEIWSSVQDFVNKLLIAFETAVPKRLRISHGETVKSEETSQH